MRFHQQLYGLRSLRRRRGQLADQAFEPFDRRGVGFHHFFRALNGFRDAGFVERLQHVIDGVHLESLDRIIVVGGSKHNLRNAQFALD